MFGSFIRIQSEPGKNWIALPPKKSYFQKISFSKRKAHWLSAKGSTLIEVGGLYSVVDWISIAIEYVNLKRNFMKWLCAKIQL